MKSVMSIFIFLLFVFSLIALNPVIKYPNLLNQFPQDNLRTWKNTETILQVYHTDWQNLQRTTYLYDTHGNYNVITTYRIFSGPDWTPYMRSTYVYNAENQLQTIDQDVYDTGIWIQYSRTTYTYVNHLNTQILTQLYENTNLENSSQITRTYNADSQVETQLMQIWTGNGWSNDLQYLYTYTPTQNVITLQNWIVDSWQFNYRESTSYDGIYPMEILHEVWQDTEWINAWKWVYSYEIPGQMSELNQYNYDPGSSDWQITQRMMETYDENGYLIHSLNQNWNGTNWTNLQQLFFTWSNITANTDPVAVNQTVQLSNFPNPFNPSTTISFNIQDNSHVNLSIYNTRGQKIKQLVDEEMQPGKHEIIWNGKDDNDRPVTSGVYFYRLTTGIRILTKKMLMLK
jgi:hypothetical protein